MRKKEGSKVLNMYHNFFESHNIYLKKMVVSMTELNKIKNLKHKLESINKNISFIYTYIIKDC